MSTAANNGITGQPLTSGIWVNMVLGAVGRVIGGAALPTIGMLPQNMSNMWNPGINARRLMGRRVWPGFSVHSGRQLGLRRPTRTRSAAASER